MARAARKGLPPPPEFMRLQKPLPLGSKPVAVKASSTIYEAGSTSSHRAVRWRQPTTQPNQMLGNLSTLRDRSRGEVRNNGWAKGLSDKLVTNIIGTGIKPLSKADDTAFARHIQDLWTSWTDQSDAAGLLDFYGQQSQACRCWLEAGEVFIRLRFRKPTDGLVVPLQIEVLEPEMCPHNWNTYAPNGNRIKAGIEFDAIGRRVAYWFFASRPGDIDDWNVGDLRRIPASSVIHVYDPLRAGQLRGLPHLTQALIRLHELDTYDDAQVQRQQVAALFAGFIRKAAGADASVNPLTGLSDTTTSTNGSPVSALEPAILQELGPGEEITFSDPPDAGQTYVAFMEEQLRAACAAAGVPYEVLTNKMTGLNDRIMRVILHEFRRGIQARQHQTIAHQLCRGVWNAWLEQVYLTQALAIPDEFLLRREPWARVKWMPQGWAYIHPVQDVDAAQKAILAGFTSRAAVVSEHGEDASVIDEEQAADNARAKALGLAYESGTDKPKAAPMPAPFPQKPEPDEDDEEPDPDEPEDPEDEDDA